MKKAILLSFLALIMFNCKAQVMPIEDKIIYLLDDNLEPAEDLVYCKDVNHLLNKFEGTWIGTYNDRTYEIIIVEHTDVYDYEGIERKEDILLLRYIITDPIFGTIIDTSTLTNDHYLVASGFVIRNNNEYYLHYSGLNANCGQFGDIIIRTIPPTNTQMRLNLILGHLLIYPEDACSPGDVEQMFPRKEYIILDKQ